MFCFSSPFGRRERAAAAAAAPPPPPVEAVPGPGPGPGAAPDPLSPAAAAAAQPCIVVVEGPTGAAAAGGDDGEVRTAPRAEPETDTASYSSSASGCSVTSSSSSSSSSGCDAGADEDGEEEEDEEADEEGGAAAEAEGQLEPLASRRGAPAPLPPLAACASSSASSLTASSSASASASPAPSPSAPGPGPRFKLLREGDVQLCYLNHTRTVISKILSSKFLRRWETHRLYLNDACISSKTPSGFMERSVPYSSVEELCVVARWDAGHRFCVRLVVQDGSLLLQANNAYMRDQWYHSILWKKCIFKYRNILKKSTRPEVVLKELKSLVELATSTPLQDECVTNAPMEIVSRLLEEDEAWTSRGGSEQLTATLAPLLANTAPSPALCRFFSRHCAAHPRSPAVAERLTPVAQRILKHNVDFGKFPHMRRLVQDYICALHMQNGGDEVLRRFVASIHGPGSSCPHPRVLPNLVAVCLAAVFSSFEERRSVEARNETQGLVLEHADCQLQCYLSVLLTVSEYDDWRPGLAQLLQPIPFPDDALAHEPFIRSFMPVMERIGKDSRCEVHQLVLGIREGKEGWFHVYCPSSLACVDEGELWCSMLEILLHCCCRRKRFLVQLAKRLGACLLLALRDHTVAQEALCLMLEWELLTQEDQKMQVVTTLQSTASGREHYAALCRRQMHLKELQQQKGGPRKLTLPSRSTDADIARLLSCGSFGNLECLSLAFTHVTSACAEQLIKLPSLRYLNLWATQFGDSGLLMISEHLHKLQVLNLCETQVSDKGIAALASMTSLRKLNLNSTKLSAHTFERLKQKLPALQEFDVRYTEAW
ncbi:hypothetical protein R5R35_009972 [Gryllus longicercus]|uniref:C-Maf-inducing protein PH domain-containing protein n=1 Tax=Gryllus longicercus TaxID=2509291 RepID=A0AAN9YXW6_9ORTH